MQGHGQTQSAVHAVQEPQNPAAGWLEPENAHMAGRYYYFLNTGLQQHSVLYTQAALDAEPQVLLDPNKLSEDGTVALTGDAFTSTTKDGFQKRHTMSYSGHAPCPFPFLQVAGGVLLQLACCSTWVKLFPFVHMQLPDLQR